MILLWVGLAGAAPTPAARPVSMIQVQVDGEAADWVLLQVGAWSGRRFVGESELLDPVNTMLRARTVKARGCQARHYRGHRLSQHEERGDTVRTVSLLLEECEGQPLSGWWHEERMEVPTRLWRLTGTLQGRELRAELVEVVEQGIPSETLRIEGHRWP